MGRDSKSIKQRKVAGNPGKRPLPKQPTTPTPPANMPNKLSKEQLLYWDALSPYLISDGRLNQLTLSSFLNMINMKIRLDKVNEFLNKTNKSMLQETKFIDPSGQEHSTFRESAYSKLSRDLSVAVSKLEKLWGITGMQMQGVGVADEDPMEAFMKGRNDK
jgi:hypothetical protein